MYRSHSPNRFSSLQASSLAETASSESGGHRPVWQVLIRALADIVVLAAGVALGVAVFRHPAFIVSQVEVEGLNHLSLTTVLERAALQGQHLLALPVDDIRATVTQESWVLRVDIQRKLPGRVILIIQEREPAAIWQAKGRGFLVDRDGVVLEENFVPRDLLAIQDLDGDVPKPGDRKDQDAIALALTLKEVLAKEMNQSARSFEYLRHGGLVVETGQGRRARFGDSSDFQWKLAVWKTLLKAGETQNLQVGHVDLRFGDRPFFRP